MDTTHSLSIDLDAIARQFQLSTPQVQATVELLDEGNTVPFITRYRKDRTGGLDEEKIRLIQDAVTRRRQLNERKERVLRSIQSQEKLTDGSGTADSRRHVAQDSRRPLSAVSSQEADAGHGRAPTRTRAAGHGCPEWTGAR